VRSRGRKVLLDRVSISDQGGQPDADDRFLLELDRIAQHTEGPVGCSKDNVEALDDRGVVHVLDAVFHLDLMGPERVPDRPSDKVPLPIASAVMILLEGEFLDRVPQVFNKLAVTFWKLGSPRKLRFLVTLVDAGQKDSRIVLAVDHEKALGPGIRP